MPTGDIFSVLQQGLNIISGDVVKEPEEPLLLFCRRFLNEVGCIIEVQEPQPEHLFALEQVDGNLELMSCAQFTKECLRLSQQQRLEARNRINGRCFLCSSA
jgi:hypothetical protein